MNPSLSPAVGRTASRRPSPAFLLVLGFCCALFSLTPPAAVVRAQQAAAPAAASSGPTVRAIDIEYVGPQTVSRERILANMRTSIGQPFTQTAVEDDIRNLYRTGELTNVRIFTEPEGDGVKVVVVVQTRSVIKEIVIQNPGRVRPRSIKKRLTSKEGGVLNEEVVEQDRQKIVTLYQDRGFADVNVQSRVEYNESAGNAVVSFTINQGGRSSLHSVNFEGNEHVSSRELRRTMKGTRSKNVFSFLTKSGRLEQLKLQQDLQAIRDLYQNRGYIDVDVGNPQITRRPNGDVDLLIVIREGPLYRVEQLNLEGTTVVTVPEIRRFLRMREGSLYTPKGLKDDVKTIQDYYGSRGYVDARVEPEGEPVGPGQVNLRYRVSEGSQSYVERINIEGNTVTKDKVIRRELALAPGDVDNSVLVDASKKRLDNLGYFSKVEINQTDTAVAGRKDLDVLVEEKKTGSLSFGAGFSSVDSLVGQIELNQGNFDLFNFPTFTGAGQKFRLALQYGTTRRDVSVSFTEPYFLDYRLAVGGEAYYRQTDYSSNDYNQRNIGFAVNARRGLTRYIATSLEYRLEEVNISNINNTSTILQRETGSVVRSSVRGGLSYDSRDSVFLTRRGTRVDFGPYIVGGPLGGNANIYGFTLNGTTYRNFPGDLILLINGELATVDALPNNTNNFVPVFDRLYLGGANNLRGYGFRGVGPKDFNGNPVGGRTLAHTTVELSYPIIERVRGAFFYDAGFVNRNAWDFRPDVRLHKRTDFRKDPNLIDNDPKTPIPNQSGSDLGFVEFGSGLGMDIGLGLRLDLPIGPIRVDYGYPLLNDKFNRRSTGKFSFNVGYQF